MWSEIIKKNFGLDYRHKKKNKKTEFYIDNDKKNLIEHYFFKFLNKSQFNREYNNFSYAILISTTKARIMTQRSQCF